jgi:hypothetical protein
MLNEDNYDEINAELIELARREIEEAGPKKIYVGSGEDFCLELLEAA